MPVPFFLRAVDGHGDASELEHPAARRHLDHLRKTVGEELAVAPSKLADRVVIGMGVAAQVPHGHAVITVALDLAAGKRPGRVAVDEQAQQQTGRVLRVARPARGSNPVPPPHP